MITSPKILVVDDEEGLRELIADSLAMEYPDAHIDKAENGKVAEGLLIAAAEEKQYDLVMSDITMPLMTGLDCLESIRTKGILTPYIIITGYGDKENAVRALRAGAFDFLEKPFDPDKLVEIAKLGIEAGQFINSLEETITNMIVERNIPAEKHEQFRKTQRLLLSMSHFSTATKKAS